MIKNPGYLRIATEEAFLTPDLFAALMRRVGDKSFDDPGFRSLWGFYGASPSQRAP